VELENEGFSVKQATEYTGHSIATSTKDATEELKCAVLDIGLLIILTPLASASSKSSS
ncbi:hypothetical protein AVEN_58809-1, partial [Araneus ventricosus]